MNNKERLKRLARLQELLKEGMVSLHPQHHAVCDLNQRAFHLVKRSCNCGATAKYTEAQKLAGQKEDYELPD